MGQHVFTTNEKFPMGIEAKTEIGYVALLYKSNGGAGLGGGTLRVWATIEGIEVPLPDSKLAIGKLDGNGDVIQMMIFSAAGTLAVELTGATSPNITVAWK